MSWFYPPFFDSDWFTSDWFGGSPLIPGGSVAPSFGSAKSGSSVSESMSWSNPQGMGCDACIDGIAPQYITARFPYDVYWINYDENPAAPPDFTFPAGSYELQQIAPVDTCAYCLPLIGEWGLLLILSPAGINLALAHYSGEGEFCLRSWFPGTTWQDTSVSAPYDCMNFNSFELPAFSSDPNSAEYWNPFHDVAGSIYITSGG